MMMRQGRTIRKEEGIMERFIHRQNIEHLEKLLQRTTDEGGRQRILKLLEEERKKMPEKPPARKRACF
jgi:hypothetical protein